MNQVSRLNRVQNYIMMCARARCFGKISLFTGFSPECRTFRILKRKSPITFSTANIRKKSGATFSSRSAQTTLTNQLYYIDNVKFGLRYRIDFDVFSCFPNVFLCKCSNYLFFVQTNHGFSSIICIFFGKIP